MKAKYNIFAFIIIGILGSLNHFVYAWFNYNRFISYFVPVNESTWEHLKLLFFPTMVFSLVEYFFVKKEIKNYIPSVVISVITGMITIILLFYGYTGVIGYNIDFLNILIFYIGLLVSLIVKNKIIDSEVFSGKASNTLFFSLALIIAIMFISFTYSPPALGIFTPPMNV